MKLQLICLSIFLAAFSLHSQEKNYYTKKNFQTLYDEFEYKKDLMRFLDIKKNDVIGDIGASSGYLDCALSLIYDSVTFYVEDINAKDLNQKSLDKEIKKYSKFRNGPQTNTFKFSIGTYTSTNLPDGIFDKIIMIASFHEFTQMDEMMADISKKLKPGGKIYILEAFSIKDKIIHCEEGHKGFRIEEVIAILKKIGYHLVKMKSPESSIVNYANCLAFEKDEALSKTFYDKKIKVEPLLQKVSLFDSASIASDSVRVKNITDSVSTEINSLTDIYIGFECWIKDIGMKYITKKDYRSAINIFKAGTQLFPNSYNNYYWLAKAYEGNKQKSLSNYYFAKAKEISF